MSETSNWKLYAIASMILSAILFCGILFLYSMAYQLDNKVWSLEKQLEDAGQASNISAKSKAEIQNSLDELVANNGDLFSSVQLESSPVSDFVVQGEQFNTELFISSSLPLNQQDVTFSVNGKSLPVKDGKANLVVAAGKTGTMSYNVTAKVSNPATGEQKELSRTFEYEVGQRAVNVFPDKMNVLYIGVDNPISVSAMGVNMNELKVSCQGCNIKKSGSKGNYSATVTKPGKATISVTGGQLPPTLFEFRAKRIPDPVARISGRSGGSMGVGEFKAQGGVVAILDNFDFDAKCKIQGFMITYVPKGEASVESTNAGARYNSQSKSLINQAKPGDLFYFDNVKAKCPGDPAGRKINSMVFKIK